MPLEPMELSQSWNLFYSYASRFNPATLTANSSQIRPTCGCRFAVLILVETDGLIEFARKLHTMDRTIQDLEDRLWDM